MGWPARFRNRFALLLALAGALWLPLAAQKKGKVTSERSAPPELGDKPTSPLKIENVKGTVKNVDLQKRTVTIAQAGGETVFSFPTAAGREKIYLSKKVARALGKKSLRLDEIPAGSQVKVAYYPALGTIMQLTIEELAR
jgi:hypothetical protein